MEDWRRLGGAPGSESLEDRRRSTADGGGGGAEASSLPAAATTKDSRGVRSRVDSRSSTSGQDPRPTRTQVSGANRRWWAAASNSGRRPPSWVAGLVAGWGWVRRGPREGMGAARGQRSRQSGRRRVWPGGRRPSPVGDGDSGGSWIREGGIRGED